MKKLLFLILLSFMYVNNGEAQATCATLHAKAIKAKTKEACKKAYEKASGLYIKAAAHDPAIDKDGKIFQVRKRSVLDAHLVNLDKVKKACEKQNESVVKLMKRCKTVKPRKVPGAFTAAELTELKKVNRERSKVINEIDKTVTALKGERLHISAAISSMHSDRAEADNLIFDKTSGSVQVKNPTTHILSAPKGKTIVLGAPTIPVVPAPAPPPAVGGGIPAKSLSLGGGSGSGSSAITSGSGTTDEKKKGSIWGIALPVILGGAAGWFIGNKITEDSSSNGAAGPSGGQGAAGPEGTPPPEGAPPPEGTPPPEGAPPPPSHAGGKCEDCGGRVSNPGCVASNSGGNGEIVYKPISEGNCKLVVVVKSGSSSGTCKVTTSTGHSFESSIVSGEKNVCRFDQEGGQMCQLPEGQTCSGEVDVNGTKYQIQNMAERTI